MKNDENKSPQHKQYNVPPIKQNNIIYSFKAEEDVQTFNTSETKYMQSPQSIFQDLFPRDVPIQITQPSNGGLQQNIDIKISPLLSQTQLLAPLTNIQFQSKKFFFDNYIEFAAQQKNADNTLLLGLLQLLNCCTNVSMCYHYYNVIETLLNFQKGKITISQLPQMSPKLIAELQTKEPCSEKQFYDQGEEVSLGEIRSVDQFRTNALFGSKSDVLHLNLEFSVLRNFQFKDIQIEDWKCLLLHQWQHSVYMEVRENTLVLPMVAMLNTEQKLYKSKILNQDRQVGCAQPTFSVQPSLRGIVQYLKRQGAQDCADLIAVLSHPLPEINEIPARSLSIWNPWDPPIAIKTPEPYMLISLSLRRMKLSNLQQCANLKYLYSIENTYEYDDVANISSLECFSSDCDVMNDKQNQEHKMSFFDILVANNNPLQYVDIYKGTNILPQMDIQRKNLPNLRYMFFTFESQSKAGQVKFIDDTSQFTPLDVLIVKNGYLSYVDVGSKQEIPVNYNLFTQEMIRYKAELLPGCKNYQQRQQFYPRHNQNNDSFISDTEYSHIPKAFSTKVRGEINMATLFKQLFQYIKLNPRTVKEYLLKSVAQQYFFVNEEFKFPIQSFLLHGQDFTDSDLDRMNLNTFEKVNNFIVDAIDTLSEIYNKQQFIAQSMFYKYFPYNPYYLFLNDHFQLKNMTQSDWLLFLDNCENKILQVYAEYKKNIFNFIVVRNCSNNEVCYFEEDQVTDQSFMPFIEEGDRLNCKYDVIIVTTRPKVTAFQNMRLRSISYFLDALVENRLTFKYPKLLRAAFLRNCEIHIQQDLNPFTKLRYLGTNFCKVSVKLLDNLKAFCSINDNINLAHVRHNKGNYDFCYFQTEGVIEINEFNPKIKKQPQQSEYSFTYTRESPGDRNNGSVLANI